MSDRVTILEEGRRLTSVRLVRRVSSWFRSQGFEVCYDTGLGGEYAEYPHHWGLGILSNSKTKPVSFGSRLALFLSNRRFIKERRMFLGLLKVDSNREGIHPQKQWLVEVYGQETKELLKPVAETLSREFNVDIHMRVVADESRWETFDSEVGSLAD